MRIAIISLVVLLAAACAARGEDNPFAQGTWNFTLSGAYTTPIRFSEAHTGSVTAAIGKYLWDNNALNLEFQGYYADQPFGEPDAIIGGIGVLGRWHFFRRDKFSLFIDGGGGVTYADNNFPTYPVTGTHFNFTGKVGGGFTWELHQHEFLTAGVRYFHLSNGQIHGMDQNPTYDSIQVWAGMMWTW